MTLLNLMLALRLAVALVLIVAGVRKLAPGGRRRLKKAISSYGILPARSHGVAAAALPWLELSLGLMLALGLLLIPAALCASVILGTFAAAVGWHAKRGRNFSCGCGSGSMISWSLAVGDAALSIAAAAVALYPRQALAVWVGPGWMHAAAGGLTRSMPVPMTVLVLAAAWRLIASEMALTSSSPTRSASPVAH